MRKGKFLIPKHNLTSSSTIFADTHFATLENKKKQYSDSNSGGVLFDICSFTIPFFRDEMSIELKFDEEMCHGRTIALRRAIIRNIRNVHRACNDHSHRGNHVHSRIHVRMVCSGHNDVGDNSVHIQPGLTQKRDRPQDR